MRVVHRFAVLAVCSFLMVPLRAQVALPAEARKAPLLLGAAWYPEQWPESRWDADLALMQKAGINFVRVGEFAWSTMEPSEGDYRFDWLERAIRLAEKHGIVVVLGTPTAAPPAWLTTKYPETLRTGEDGRKDQHGERQQFDFGSAKYRVLAADIAGRMAEKFGHDANVIGWQIDNEYAATSYGEDNKIAFQDWLHAKYGTLDNLNTRWTTSYWSQTYSDWRQIPLEESSGNPGLLLNWREFVTDTWRGYQKNQLDAIRAHADARQKITTNMMGWFDAYDHYKVAADLDFASWDDYVRTGHVDPADNGAQHDLTRGFLHKNFWVMETQPGFVNWQATNASLDKGEVRAMAWNAIGHGAEAVEYWQWRSALNGQEEYHGTLVGADGTPVPVYGEVAQVGAEFHKAAAALDGTTVESEVAVLQDYDSRWAIKQQKHNLKFDAVQSLLSYYRPLHEQAQSVDVVSDVTPLDRYKLVVAPALNLVTPEALKNLEAYVRGGGHLVLGQRSGMKDEDNGLWPQRQPGPFAALLGARVEQFYSLDKPVTVSGDWGSGETAIWAEMLGSLAPDTKVVMRYGKLNGWIDGQPAVVTRRVGKGSITYVGAALEGETMSHAVASMLKEAGVMAKIANVPAGVDVAVRSGGGKRVVILTNYGAASKTVTLPAAMTDVLHGGPVQSVTLGQYDVAVLQAR